jgi:hypothetical protein
MIVLRVGISREGAVEDSGLAESALVAPAGVNRKAAAR